ncbi:hypothetical protein TTHERM_000927011 (macronuclear) [Tetrahymena thermophila SB210]|uniref:Uncharacterized protein n=1 Tax=Tetrahymena thermophila (strain SB210) TaxID=312017 RepID=W7XEG8_TETTS|nr:hypothetical protein TTHERM_000927011 [Tetrahymena thermophila SB210]EWS75043.1 hypothetical protein TTHERM_000927011 [Tetrahymena thermophila SB210]|eukprot:XP_012652418.1 hypothetical protein TTHERM_000927011 [Tetrahymena thermophila SB210]
MDIEIEFEKLLLTDDLLRSFKYYNPSFITTQKIKKISSDNSLIFYVRVGFKDEGGDTLNQ